MRPTRFNSYCHKVFKRENKREPKPTFPKLLIDFAKRGIISINNLLGIGAHQEGTKNSTTSQEDAAENHDAVVSKPTTGKDNRYLDNNVDMELDDGHSVDTRKRRRSLEDEEVCDPERVKLRKHDRLALLTAASSPSKVEVATLPIASPFVQRKKHILDLTKQDNQKDLPYFATPKTDAYAYSPTPEEARGMLAIESLVRGTYLDRARQIPTAYPSQLVDYDNYKYYPPYHTIIRPVAKDVKEAKQHKPVSQQAATPYNKESRKARVPQPRYNARPSSGYNADVSDHAREENNVLQHAPHARDHRWPASPLKQRSSVSEMQLKPSRVSRGAVTKRTSPSPPQKRRPILAGRYSALDTDDEEEEINKILKEREQITVNPVLTASRATTPPAPEKRRPTLPGRYSALDTDDEEEEINKILKERVQTTRV
ncbi:hypothetical protein DFQ27_006405 [Actinomortierella ambigua]|uniref:Uncharacterized protein n=1 Tax=Actinomortierella ambigua TaxID=1343610 RepID=A0A9P6U148_9FUNG|nr:hypothetical protein DFQ27_006405 [Actinomortierella ambigua]